MGVKCSEAYYSAFSFPEVAKTGKIRKQEAIIKSFHKNILYYIPIINAIFAAVMLSAILKGSEKLSAQDKAMVARCVLAIALAPIGFLLVIADIAGTAMRARAQKPAKIL